MCIGPDDGCQEVPDPIAPIDMTFESLDPTRMPMSLSDITISGPRFIDPIWDVLSMPFISPIAPGEGLAVGIGMFIFFSGDACGFGEAVGIGIPGIFICVCGDGEGEADGIGMPGMFICICGDGEGEADGIGMPGMFICICCGDGFVVGVAVCFGDGAAWVFGIFIPGMLIPGILPIRFFLAGRLFRATLLFLGAAFRLAFDLGFGIFIPGMFCMSC
jgi:hypothetical protein